MSLSLAGLHGSDVVHAAAGGAQNLLDLLDRRSPGQRTEGQLTKTKHKHVALAKVRVPRPQAPPSVVATPPAQPDLAAILLSAPPVLPAESGTPFAQFDLGPPPTLGGSITPGGPSIAPPGGDTPASFPTTQPRVPVVTPPVPEPGTWATMLLGFAAIGWRLRRRARTSAQPSPA